MNDQVEPEGLRGWLILVGIGVVIGPLRILVIVLQVYYPIFIDGTWEVLTTAGSAAYHPLWAPLLLGELIFNTGMILVSCYLAFLFFTKNRLFPSLYVILMLISLVFIPFDAWFASFVVPNEPMFDPETTQEFVRTLIASAIWVPYMFMSRRVKNTFTPDPDESRAIA